MTTHAPHTRPRSMLPCTIASALLLLWTLALLAPAAAGDEGEGSPEVTNGGYMQTSTADGRAVPLPLKHTDVQAEIAGFVAAVQVTQTFTNPFDKPIEALYVFPLPERSAVHAMTMYLGKRVIRGTIQKKEEARRIYEEAKAAGKTAALLDQERPNIFTQSVANILPGEEIKVELAYVEDLKYRHGEYEFVFPLVVGPRFIPGNVAIGKQGTGWSLDTDRVPDASRITPPLLRKGMRPGNDVAVRVVLDAGLAIEQLQSPSHQVQIDRPDAESATVILSPADSIPNKDFVLRYRVAGERPRVALLTEKDKESGYFLLMIQPRIPDAGYRVAPREYVFVVDTSGSMSGFPLEQAKKLIRECLTSIGKNDTFQVVGFAGNASFLFPTPVKPTRENVQQALAQVNSLQGGGGTQLLPALDLALNSPRDPGRSRVVLFLSDGYIGYENQVLRYLRSNLRGANLFALGVGSSVNRFLIEGMARLGQGEPFYLLSRDKPEPVVQRFYEYVSRPSLTDIEVDWGGLDVQEIGPAYLADLFAERPLFVVGRYGQGGQGKVQVSGRYAGEPYRETIEVELPDRPHGNGSGISYLWARRMIAELMDVFAIEPQRKEEAKKSVTELALQFHLTSEFTSFVAVDEQVRSDGSPETVPVAVPLPENVSELAAPPAAFVGSAVATPMIMGAAAQAPPPAAMPLMAAPRKMALKPATRMALPAEPAAVAPSPARGDAGGGLGLSGSGRGGGGYGMGALSLSQAEAKGKRGPGGADRDGESERRRHEIAAPKAAVALAQNGLRLAGGGEPGKEMVRALQTLLPSLVPAYQNVLEMDPYARGKVVLRLELAANGKVTRVSVVSSPFGGKTFKDQLVAAAGGWTVAATGGAAQVLVLELLFGG